MTLAAALTVGLIAGATNLAFADCGCNSPVVTGGACPLTQITTDTCNKCKKHKNHCKCKPKKVNKCDCVEKKSCTACEDDITTCDGPDIATSGTCPTNTCADKCKHQIYAYPAGIYGLDNVRVGETEQGVMVSEGNNITPTLAMTSGVPVALAPDCGCETGAAAQLPCLNDCCGKVSGIPVERDCQALDGANCPINVQTESSMEAIKKTMVPFEYTPNDITGAAAPLMSYYPDVPSGFWASCDINKLTENNVVVGYPDRTFKPNMPVSRAEFASMAVKGLNLNDNFDCPQTNFKDVPKSHWANKVVNKSVSEGLMRGYPNNMFKPDHPVSRAEALTILSKGVKCDIDDCKAQEILNKYCDGNQVPTWAAIPVAKSLNAGALSDSPSPTQIRPNADASRAELASMLEQVRIAGGYSTKDIASASTPGCGCTGGAAYMEKTETVTIPTLKICFDDELTARTAHVNDRFAAKTIDPMTINGVLYPEGSVVRGKVLEVERPSKCNNGALKLSFDTIENCDCKTDLPSQVLTAQVNRTRTPNPVARFIQWPFATVGQIIGTAGRAVGGAAISVSNAAEQVFSEFGTGTGEVFQGQFKAAGRSYLDTGKAILKAPIDLTRTAISGVSGIVQVTGEEVAYLVDPDGKKISAINPREKVTIAFGCNSCK